MGGKNSFYHRTILGGPAPKSGGSPAASKTVMNPTGGTDPNSSLPGNSGSAAANPGGGSANGGQIAGDTPEQTQQKALVASQEADKAAAEAYALAHPPGPVFVTPKSIAEAEKQMIARQAAIANGVPGSSISQMALNQATDQASHQSMALAASQRGSSNPALAFRQAQLGNQQMLLENAQAGAITSEQERRQADHMIAAQAAAHKGVAIQQAAIDQQAKTADKQAAAAEKSAYIGAVGQIGASAATASDKNLKKDIKPSDSDGSKAISEFMDAIKSYTYEYKNKSNNGKELPGGKVTSVMAQDLEKTNIGKKMVHEGPDGKMVDYAQGMAPLFAAIAELNERTKHLDKKKA